MKIYFLFLSVCISSLVMAQKKPLDHTVYDSWQSIGERMISNDGKWVVYTITPQEGDNELVIQSADASYKKTVQRGSTALITQDSRFVIFTIKPFFKDTRDARIKKKKADDMPKDSLAIIELGKDSIWKVAKVKGYKIPEKGIGWAAYHLEKVADTDTKAKKTDNDGKKVKDSLTRVIDSLQEVILSIPKKKRNKDAADALYETDADGDDAAAAPAETGTDLVLRKLGNGEEKVFRHIVEYYFSKTGNKLLMEQSRNPKDSFSNIAVLLYDLDKGRLDTLSKGANEFKNFTMAEDGSQLAYLAERDAKPKELQKFYKLWYYKEGMDSATVLVDKSSVGMKLGMTVSPFGNLAFSKTGKRLFFGTSAVEPPKDTTLVEIDLVKLDVWHYKDDYLQTVQLNRLKRDQEQSYFAVYDFGSKQMEQLGSVEIPAVYQTNEGDGDTFVGVTDYGNRIEGQWTGDTKKDIYAIHVKDGSKKLVKKALHGVISPAFISPTGKYIMWYEHTSKNYFVYDGDSARNITAKIKVPLYDEENDSPDDPNPYGIMSWHEGDSAVYIYDRYDVWKVDVIKNKSPELITSFGRIGKIAFRYLRLNEDEKFITFNQELFFKAQDQKDKSGSVWSKNNADNNSFSLLPIISTRHNAYNFIAKAKNSKRIIYTKESYTESPDLYLDSTEHYSKGLHAKFKVVDTEKKLSSINPQQKEYNWGTAELYNWKTFKGKPSTGILYKPENFDATKKYPLILYFYEKLSDGLYTYQAPSPTPSRLNISFFVSRGYLVFAPDIAYTIGHPAQSAYDYIVSAAKSLAKNKWVDAKNIGIQGQSWGGIQVAQLVTMTDMFKAAWAGAPVANMTSAYGGIRWESGANRQFQYEKTQSRIGATLWEKPQLYIENSPLFHLPKVKTPLVIMANDADGAVPWYQGIELFTAMRRLGKQVWMLNYNGEGHNLVQRKNRKDIQIREQQFFDWLLKGEKPAKWITEGVPAVKKGKDWGLELEQ